MTKLFLLSSIGITCSADCLGYCVMCGLLYPNRSGQYLLLTSANYSGMDELDLYNEAPHVVSRQSYDQALVNSIDVYNDEGNDGDSETVVLSTDDLLVSNHVDNSEDVIFSRDINNHTAHDFTDRSVA